MVILDTVTSQRPKVLNKNNPDWMNEPGKTIYIGRGTPWGNIMKSQRPRVLNKNNPNWVNEPGKTIYIGRGSPWGNPYRLTENTRKERHLRINQFKVDFLADEVKVAEAKRILKGANLLCFCDPEPCHGHFLLDLVNPVDEEDLFD